MVHEKQDDHRRESFNCCQGQSCEEMMRKMSDRQKGASCSWFPGIMSRVMSKCCNPQKGTDSEKSESSSTGNHHPGETGRNPDVEGSK